MDNLNLKFVAVLMPFEIKRHTVPHLKALNMQVGMGVIVILSSAALS